MTTLSARLTGRPARSVEVGTARGSTMAHVTDGRSCSEGSLTKEPMIALPIDRVIVSDSSSRSSVSADTVQRTRSTAACVIS